MVATLTTVLVCLALIGLVFFILAIFRFVRTWLDRQTQPGRKVYILLGALIAFVLASLIWEAAFGDEVAIAATCCLIGMLVVYYFVRLVWILLQRPGERTLIYSHLDTTVRQRLPLGTTLELAAESETGRRRHILQAISQHVSQGVPLAQAVQVGYPQSPGIPVSMLIAGQRAGCLSDAVSQVHRFVEQDARLRSSVHFTSWGYFLLVGANTILVVSGLMVAVLPKFRAIFADFGTHLPFMTLVLFGLAEWFVSWPGSLISILAILTLGLGVYWAFRPRRVPEPAWTSRVADWVRWYTPGLRRIERSRGLSAMLRTIDHAVGSGMALDEAARLSADLDVNVKLRAQMRDFADRLAKGTQAGQAARAAGLGEVTAVAMDSGLRSHNLSDGLRYAADYNEALVSRFWIFIRNLAWPLATLVLACIMGFVALAMFLPLVQLINAVAGPA